jgi:hypothetical protein
MELVGCVFKKLKLDAETETLWRQVVRHIGQPLMKVMEMAVRLEIEKPPRRLLRNVSCKPKRGIISIGTLWHWSRTSKGPESKIIREAVGLLEEDGALLSYDQLGPERAANG